MSGSVTSILHSQAARGRVFARVVTQRSVACCEIEQQLQERGAHVTRLLAADLVIGQSLDQSIVPLLGKLYDGVIVPHDDTFSASYIAAASGVPVVFEDQDVTALTA